MGTGDSGEGREPTPPEARSGRPPFAPGERRDRRVVTFLTQEQYARLQQRAQIEDRSISLCVQRMLAAELKSGDS